MTNNNRTLILNLDGTPLSVVTSKRAISLLMNSKHVQPISFYDKYVKFGRGEFRVPAVLIYTKYVHYDIKKMPNKKLVIKRDNHECQYCGERMLEHEATVDHVRPIESFKNKAEANTWLNMVAACRPCNFRKANKSLERCGMKLRRQPRLPTREDVFNFHNPPKEWAEFLKGKKK